MSAVFSVPITRPFFPLIAKPTKRPVSVAVSANSQPSRRRSSENRKQQQIRKQNQETQNQRAAATNQLSGLDVLWAMQRAAAAKNRAMQGAAAEKNRASPALTKKNRKEESRLLSESGHREKNGGDYRNVRPLLIKNDWASRLDDLEKRLQELLDSK